MILTLPRSSRDNYAINIRVDHCVTTIFAVPSSREIMDEHARRPAWHFVPNIKSDPAFETVRVTHKIPLTFESDVSYV